MSSSSPFPLPNQKFALPISPSTGAVDLNMLYNRWVLNLKSFKYNYLVTSLLPLSLLSVYYWSIPVSIALSLCVFAGVHISSSLAGPSSQRIGSHVVTKFDKVRVGIAGALSDSNSCDERSDTMEERVKIWNGGYRSGYGGGEPGMEAQARANFAASDCVVNSSLHSSSNLTYI